MGFSRVRKMSSWRRISLHMWGRPADPTVYGNLEIDVSRTVAYLDELNALQDAAGSKAKVTITHLVAKAIARAITEYPDSNAIIAGRALYRRDSVDVYCQVATDGGEDLSGLKIVDANDKSAIDIAEEMSQRVHRVLTHKDPGSERTKNSVSKVPHRFLGVALRLIEYLTFDLFLDLSRFGVEFDQFGSAMVSNVGSFGIGHGFAPLVPASRVPIVLLVGEIADRVIVQEGQIVAAPAMTIGCTFDHRLIDGYQAGNMARVVKDTLKDPYSAFGLPSRSSSTGALRFEDQRDETNTHRSGNAYTGRKLARAQETARRPTGGAD